MKGHHLLAAVAMTTSPIIDIHAAEQISGSIDHTIIASGDTARGKTSIDITTDTTAGKINLYLSHGDDPRVGATDFTSGGISWADENLSLGARGLLLDSEAFGELYGKLTGELDIYKGADAWIRVGVTNPTGSNISGGMNIKLTDDDALFVLGSHQEGLSDGPQGSLWKVELTHDFGNGIKVYGGTDYLDGDDTAFPKSNPLDITMPPYKIFGLHGQGLTTNIGARYTEGNTTIHAKASYNQDAYWNFTGEVSQKLSDNMTLSGGVLIDTRDNVNTTGYVGVKYKF